MGITKTELHSENINLLAMLFDVLGHPARISILFLLKERGYTTVGELASTIQLTQSTISEHIRELKKIPLIKGTVVGNSIHYELNDVLWEEVRNILIYFAQEF